MQEMNQCTGFDGPKDRAVGIRAPGSVQRLSIRLGRMTSGTFCATSSAASTGIIWGYNTGAGSKVDGMDIGIVLDGFPDRYAQAVSLTGYSARSPSNSWAQTLSSTYGR